MKFRSYLIPALLAGSSASVASAAPETVEPPVPVVQAPPSAPMAAPAPRPSGGDYQQRLYGPGGPLVAPEKANQVVQEFRVAYEKLGKPRILFFVNRDLVDENSGLKLSGRHEKTETTVSQQRNAFGGDMNANNAAGSNSQSPANAPAADRGQGNGTSETRNTTVTGENTYAASDKPAPTLADKLTVREIETLIGRPFRVSGATLADQKVAASLIADQPIDHFTTATNESARKDRDALAKIADVVIEVLVSSRTATVTEISGDRTVSIPDIQLTAIRLSDSTILGQASAVDVLGKGQEAAQAAGRFDVRDITEATALALMEDMMSSAK